MSKIPRNIIQKTVQTAIGNATISVIRAGILCNDVEVSKNSLLSLVEELSWTMECIRISSELITKEEFKTSLRAGVARARTMSTPVDVDELLNAIKGKV